LAIYSATLVQLDRSWFPPSENPDNHPQKKKKTKKKKTVQPRDAFEDTALKLGFEIVKF
jgi:hypothetical protein